MEKNYVSYLLQSSQKRAREFRQNPDYKKMLAIALKGKFKAEDTYQQTDIAEGKKHRGRIIGTMLKNLVRWGFLVKTGEKDSLYRQEYFTVNEAYRKEIRYFLEE